MNQNQTIRKNLHQIIDNIEDVKVLEAVYVLLEKKTFQSNTFNLSDEQKNELDKSSLRHETGESKSYSWEGAKKIILGK